MEKRDPPAAVAQETRLDIYRLLVGAGPDGRAAGQTTAALGLAGATARRGIGAWADRS